MARASALEESLWIQMMAEATVPKPEREFRFHPERKWRFDFAWPEVRLAAEVEGAVHRIKGRFRTDLEKYNEATLAGWRVLRFGRGEILESDRAIDCLCRALVVARKPLATVPLERRAQWGIAGRSGASRGS